MPYPNDAPLIGETLRHYRVLEVLGSGGMGMAYRAQDTRLNRVVTLKTLRAGEEGDQKGRRRLLREARAAASLDHPNICTIYAIEEWNDQVFIAMEFVDGRTLAERLEDGPLDPPVVVEYGVSVADALAYAHARGILHRDVKPSNIMVSGSGRIKILDFGLAGALPAASLSLSTDSSAADPAAGGTVAYMSPEQIDGLHPLDVRSDIFSLGIVLYEMSTGRNPFLGETYAGTLARTLTVDVDPVTRVVPGFPADLAVLIARCMERDIRRRPAEASDVASALRALRGAVPAGTRPGSRPSVAVLPFADLNPSADPYFSDGITTELTGRLAKIRDLLVISRTSAMRYRDSGLDVRQIGSELGVAAVVEGSVRRTGDDCSLNVELVDVTTGFHLWADRFDVPLSGIFDAQEAVSRHIAAALDPGRPKGKAQARTPTSDMRAFEAYLRAMHAYHKFTDADNRVAIELLEKSIALDPGYADAHALLANAYVARVERGWDAEAMKWFGLALSSCAQALQQDPGISRAHSARSSINLASGELARAEVDARAALEHDPNNDIAHDLLGRVHMFRGDFQGAIASFRRALTVNPYYVWCLNDLAWVQWLTGDETGANRTLDRVLAISPGDEAAHSGKAGLYLLQGLLDEALVQIRAAESVNPGYFFVTMLLPAVLARRGDFEEAEACCRRALARDPHSFAGHASLGLVLAAAGRGSEAETSLEAALAIPPFYPPLSLNYAVLYDAAGWVPAAGRWVSKAIAEGVRITPDSTVHPRILTLYQQLT